MIPLRPTKEHVRKVRDSAKLNRRQFAELLSVSPTTVNHWEQGLRNMPASTWQLALIRTGLAHTPAFFESFDEDKS